LSPAQSLLHEISFKTSDAAVGKRRFCTIALASFYERIARAENALIAQQYSGP